MTMPAYYLDGPEVDIDAARLYCGDHGARACRLLNHLNGWRHPYRSRFDDARSPGVAMHLDSAGADSFRYCRVCGVLLDAGGLSDAGVRQVLDDVSQPGSGGIESLTADELDMLCEAVPETSEHWSLVCTEYNRRLSLARTETP